MMRMMMMMMNDMMMEIMEMIMEIKMMIEMSLIHKEVFLNFIIYNFFSKFCYVLS